MIILLAVAIICAFTSSALAQSLFVTCQKSNNVAVIDSSVDQVTTQIPVGASPIRIATTPDRLKAYVSNGASGTVSALDTVTFAVNATISVRSKPEESAISPDGGRSSWFISRPCPLL